MASQLSPRKASSQQALGNSFRMLSGALLFQACRETGTSISSLPISSLCFLGATCKNPTEVQRKRGNHMTDGKQQPDHPNFCLPPALPAHPTPSILYSPTAGMIGPSHHTYLKFSLKTLPLQCHSTSCPRLHLCSQPPHPILLGKCSQIWPLSKLCMDVPLPIPLSTERTG